MAYFREIRSFSKVTWVLCLFLGFSGVLVVLKVSVGIVVVLGAFGHLLGFWDILDIHDIF